jgi:hypothetical protein
VSITNLRHLHHLLWLVLIFQVSTVLLVLAGPVPPSMPLRPSMEVRP